MDSTKFVQILFRIYAFYRFRGHAITKCPQIDNEVRDGFVKHTEQHMLDKDFRRTTIAQRTDSKQSKRKDLGNYFG